MALIVALGALAVVLIYAGTRDRVDVVPALEPDGPLPDLSDSSDLSSVAASSEPDLVEAQPLQAIASSSDPVAVAAQELTVHSAPLRPYVPPAAAAPYLEAIRAAEVRYGLPENLLVRQLEAESDFNPRARSGAGAQGIAQFMPATAKDLSVDPWNPWAAIDAAGRYMKQLFNIVGSWRSALAAYNWGVGNVQRHGTENMPQETVDYLAKITSKVPVT